jgi:hypothetical protein
MTGTKPAKPWRVYGRGPASTDHRSQRAAYEAVETITKMGGRARVYHWEAGSWGLYEVIEAATEATT